MEEWFERAAKFGDLAKQVKRMANRLNRVKNRSLLYDVYPYVWDMCGVVGLLNSYVDWLGTPTSAHAFDTPALMPSPVLSFLLTAFPSAAVLSVFLSLLPCGGLVLLLLLPLVFSWLPSLVPY